MQTRKSPLSFPFQQQIAVSPIYVLKATEPEAPLLATARESTMYTTTTKEITTPTAPFPHATRNFKGRVGATTNQIHLTPTLPQARTMMHRRTMITSPMVKVV